MKTLLCAALAALALLAPLPASAADPPSIRPDHHAPIGIMGDHVHHKGEWMLSYRFMQMEMSGLRNGSKNRSKNDVLANFPVAPRKMRTYASIFGAMFAPSDELTLMAMVPYIRKSMTHSTGLGTRFTTSSDDVGDTRVTALYSLWRKRRQSIHLNLGVSIPSGSVTEKDQTPAGRVRLPYPMQLGSGSWELHPGLTYNGQSPESYSWGAQAIGVFTLDENRKDWQNGPRGIFNVWTAYALLPELSLSARAQYQVWSSIHGSDPSLNPAIVPTADANKQGGRRLDLGFGANWVFQSGVLRGHRLAIEWLVPTYRWKNGPALETDWTLIAGWQRAF